MQQPILMPELGLADMTASIWLVKRGDEVTEGDRLLEILADGVTVDLPAPCSGRLVKTMVAEDDRLDVGQLLGVIEMTEPAAEDESAS